MKKAVVDVPVRVNIWIRPECQRRQFEVLKQARPSIIFLQSDGGRNDDEWNVIMQNRKMFETEIDWECKIYPIYSETNLGMYAMSKKSADFIWKRVDRCIFLEDDYIPAISFFRYCKELLEKYKDDKRIEMITGNNVLGVYEAASQYDYFFSEIGWSIWGIATWKDRYFQNTFPLEYNQNKYIKDCLKSNLPNFWYKKVEGYTSGKMVDGHVPGAEYYHAVNSVLHHRLSIIPTKNMIMNIGIEGEHSNKNNCLFNMPIYEINGKIRHPNYVIDDKKFGEIYLKTVGHKMGIIKRVFVKGKNFILLIKTGGLINNIKRKMGKIVEK